MAKKKVNPENLNQVIIEASNYGDLKGDSIYFTDDLFNEIKDKKDKSNVSVLSKVKNGKFMRGLKHLLTDIKASNKANKLILTKGTTRKDGTDFYINYNDYTAKGQSKFLGMYRDAGFEVAGGFLHQAFPTDFENPKQKISRDELKKVESEFGDVVNKLSEKAKNKKLILQETTKFIENLRQEKYELKRDIELLKELKEKSNIYYYQTKLRELDDRLNEGKTFHETAGKNSWQRWILS